MDETVNLPAEISAPPRWQRLRLYASVLRLKPYDTSTPSGRSLERYRRIALTSAASLLAKIVHSAVLLLSVPLAVGYLGKERYGLWMTISSVVAMFAFSDLGLGNGLMSTLTEAYGKDDRQLARRAVSSAFFVLVMTVACLGLLFAIIYPFVNWGDLFGVSSPLALREVGPSLAIFVAIFLMGIPISVAQSIQNGYQEGFANSLWQAVMSTISFIGLIIAIHFRAGLPWLVLGWTGSIIVVRLMMCAQVFVFSKPWLAPAIGEFHWTMACRLLKIGFVFLVISMSLAVGYSSDSIVLAKILGAESVTPYSIIYRLFSIVTVMVSFFLLPLWPAYGEAISRGDIHWVRRAVYRSTAITIAFNGAAGFLLLCFGRWIIRHWVGDVIDPSFWLLLPFAIYLVVVGMHGPLSMLLNGMQIIRFQLICWGLMAVTNLIFSILLTYRVGVAGVMYGTSISTFFFLVLPEAWYTQRLLSRSSASTSRGTETAVPVVIPLDAISE